MFAFSKDSGSRNLAAPAKNGPGVVGFYFREPLPRVSTRIHTFTRKDFYRNSERHSENCYSSVASQ